MTGNPQAQAEPQSQGAADQPVRILLASSRDWFASALQAVLEPEGFSFVQVRSGATALQESPEIDPALVIIDEGLPDMETPELCRRLAQSPARSSLPILVYSPNFWQESEQAEAMQAGAWDVIREPVRSLLLVAKLKRLLRIRELIETADQEAAPGGEGNLFTFAGLVRILPILGSLAQRNQVPLSCAVFGPTRLDPEALLERRRRDTARLCSAFTRTSDVCASVGETDMVLVAYGADTSAATLIIRRLNEVVLAEETAEPEAVAPLSAGIVELSPEEFVRSKREDPRAIDVPDVAPVAEQIARLSRFAAAQNALREAREAGGGIRVAEIG